MRLCALVLTATLLAGTARADDDSWLDRTLTRLGASKEVDLSKGIDWGVLPGPFYNPEMGVGIGMAAVGLYKPPGALPDTQLSTLTLKGFVSSVGAIGLGFDNNTFFGDDSWRFQATGMMVNLPTAYWGVGYDAGSDDANKHDYTKEEFSLAPKILRRVAPNTYVGVGWSLTQTHATEVEAGSAIDTDPDGPSVLASGITAHFYYDSRDFIPNPKYGQALQVNAAFYAPGFGSDNRFQTLETIYDYYHPVGEHDVLALDIYSHLAWGDVPWTMMSQLGNGNRMRGYFLGQYRDKDVISAQLEYRHHITGRHGVVFWGGAGTLADSVGGLGKDAPWLPTVGVGYRFEFKPRVNVRLDFGVGRDTAGVYFQINEAF
ncbi:BamA/TamA family outer membrane protein [Jeongeupia naejangsanensis]|uniref:BamA/TamA family outer membrane protein n=1 Tax=Jeongeupia naejangsanensis TaxID=613195 RepID=A0ABS2BFK6_9NEIS|nr:BamA/TamA family outer membrane protein [Jeongeupia naejangsanensis]MBM3114391.1 BamA/TamA family outer membrane protein [Jeongeupia naejangsanensis]